MCESVCVSEASLKEMKDILMTWTAARGGGLWRTVNIDVYVFVCFICACMYEEYLHSLTSSLTGGQTLVKQVPPSYPPAPFPPLLVYLLI